MVTLILKTDEKCWHSPTAICDWRAGTSCSGGKCVSDQSLGCTVKNEGKLFHVDCYLLYLIKPEFIILSNFQLLYYVIFYVFSTLKCETMSLFIYLFFEMVVKLSILSRIYSVFLSEMKYNLTCLGCIPTFN